MRLLLDSHIVLWWLNDDPSLSADVRSAIADTENHVYVSSVSIWEIVIKRALGKLDLPEEWPATLAEEPFRQLPVTWEHAHEVARLENIHRDPFDRLLVAQATVEDLVLVTHEAILARYGIPVLKT